MIFARLLGCGLVAASVVSHSSFAESSAQPSANTAKMNFLASAISNEYPEVVFEQYNRDIAQTALKALFFDADEETVDQYFSPDYVQHNPLQGNGMEGVKAFFIHSAPEDRFVESDFLMVDGNYALAFTRFSGWTNFFEAPILAADIYKIDGDKVVEHWDVFQVESSADKTLAVLPNNSYSEYVSEQQEKHNADIVRKAIAGLLQGDETVVDSYFSDDYIEHDPTLDDGKGPLRELASRTLPDGFSFEVGFLIADGPYVAVQTRTPDIDSTDEDPAPVISADVFRLANNMIVEHWVLKQQEVPAQMTASGNPMFPVQAIIQYAN